MVSAAHDLNGAMSVEDYLEAEKITEVKHELIDGQLYAMTGTSVNHGRVVQNLSRILGNYLLDRPCEPFVNDIKVRVKDNFYYPDLLVTCDGDDPDDYYRNAPIILVEVLSKSTRRHDKSHKRMIYQTIPSLEEYLLIEQDFVEVEVCRRKDGWQCRNYFLGDSFTLDSVDITLDVAELYHRVTNSDMSEWLSRQSDE